MSVSEERCICKTCGRVYSGGERFCGYDGSDLQPERPAGSDPLLGTVLAGSYTLLEKLGAGGMGVVYQAWQHRLERNVAIKVLSPKLGGDGAAEERFRTEALAVSRLTNPHTVAVHDFGSTEDGLLYLVMKLAPGESLRARLARRTPGLRTAVSIAAQICESLAEAHERRPQIVHRDIKPDNILVHREADGADFVTVLDFGLAKLANTDRVTQTGLIVGTPKYMAPEQAQDDKTIDARVDLYSLGVVLFEMVTGRVPFEGVTTAALLYRHVWETPEEMRTVRPDLSIPADLERIVQDLLAKRADDRPATAHIVRARLLEILKKLPADPPEVESSAQDGAADEPPTESSPAVVHPLVPDAMPQAGDDAPVRHSAPTVAVLSTPPPSIDPAAEETPLASPELSMLGSRRRWSRNQIGIAAGAAVVAIALTVYALSGSEPAPAPQPVVAETPQPKPAAAVVAVTSPVPANSVAQPVTASIVQDKTPRAVEVPRSAPKAKPVLVPIARHASKPPPRNARAESHDDVRSQPAEEPEVIAPKPPPETRPQRHQADDFPVVPE